MRRLARRLVPLLISVSMVGGVLAVGTALSYVQHPDPIVAGPKGCC